MAIFFFINITLEFGSITKIVNVIKNKRKKNYGEISY